VRSVGCSIMSNFDQITLNYGISGAIPSAEVFSPRFGICSILKQVFSFVNSLQKYSQWQVGSRRKSGTTFVPWRIERSARVPLVVIGLSNKTDTLGTFCVLSLWDRLSKWTHLTKLCMKNETHHSTKFVSTEVCQPLINLKENEHWLHFFPLSLGWAI